MSAIVDPVDLAAFRAAIDSGPAVDHGPDPDGAGPEFDWLTGAPMDPDAEPPEPFPTLPGFPYLHAGAGAVIVGPTGAGRSSLAQAGAYDAARAGLRVAYLGSEVTEPEFNARARDLADRRGDSVDAELRQQLARSRYLNLASVITQAWEEPARWTAEIPQRYDVVILDPLSTVASALDLDFDRSNAEFVRFYDKLVQPLATAGVAVPMLDNVGHALEARGRAKGVSAKQDRADLTFACKLKTQPLGLIIIARKVRTVRAPFAHGDQWTFDRDTQRVERDSAQGEKWRPTIYMERISKVIEDTPGLSREELLARVKGKHNHLVTALALLIAEGFIRTEPDGRVKRHYTVKPFREADDNDA